MNALNSFDKTDREYSVASAGDLEVKGQRWRSQQAVEVAKASTSMLGHCTSLFRITIN